MKNPLYKRIFMEIKGEWKKFLLLFFVLTGIIGFISGIFVAGSSMSKTAVLAYEKYNIEDGHIIFDSELSSSLLAEIEKECNIKMYPTFYKEVEERGAHFNSGDELVKVRIFANRSDINRACVLEGLEPSSINEIAIDRLHADNNKIKLGSTITVDSIPLSVCGLISLSDYTALFKSNTDTMFDSLTFDVAIVTKECFDRISATTVYQYSYSDNVNIEDVVEKRKRAEELIGKFAHLSYGAYKIIDFVPEFINQSINYAKNDFGADMAFAEVFLMLLICVIAFLFAISTSATIQKESKIIGAIKAMGYSSREILWHYIAPVIILVLVSAICGNILGYTLFKNIGTKMYYNSYSLPTYETFWNFMAFVKTTIIPLALVILINFTMILVKLRYKPLLFLQDNNSLLSKAKAIPLPPFPFKTRFKMRIVIQNWLGYLTLLLGIFFVMILLTFSIGLPRTIAYQKEHATENVIAPYQYMFKEGQKNIFSFNNQEKNIEPFSFIALETVDGVLIGETVFLYGYEDDSRYIRIDSDIDRGECAVSLSYSQKYHLKVGDLIILKERYDDKRYEFRIVAISDASNSISCFIPRKNFNALFELEEQEFSGIFCDIELEEIDEAQIATVITKEDIVKQFLQLDHSVGYVMKYFAIISLVISFLIILLLTKLIIEHNSKTISMVKVLGYEDKEINSLYLHATTFLVVLFAVVLSVLSKMTVEKLWGIVMSRMSGWFLFTMKPSDYLLVIGLVVLSYCGVLLINFNRVKKIPMVDAIKNVE